jgi:hypothetical protein
MVTKKIGKQRQHARVASTFKENNITLSNGGKSMLTKKKLENRGSIQVPCTEKIQ